MAINLAALDMFRPAAKAVGRAEAAIPSLGEHGFMQV